MSVLLVGSRAAWALALAFAGATCSAARPHPGPCGLYEFACSDGTCCPTMAGCCPAGGARDEARKLTGMDP